MKLLSRSPSLKAATENNDKNVMEAGVDVSFQGQMITTGNGLR